MNFGLDRNEAFEKEHNKTIVPLFILMAIFVVLSAIPAVLFPSLDWFFGINIILIVVLILTATIIEFDRIFWKHFQIRVQK